MKKTLFAGALAAVVLGAVFTLPATASCRDNSTCFSHGMPAHKHAGKKTYASRKNVAKAASNRVRPATGPVVAMIKSMAPSYGVPTWFALRIAKVESGYNPRARGSAGELGVYQLKCATAKGIGFRGKCSALLDARTNVRFGLKHLSLALKSSRGNLRLAASKHNGGLGRKTIVRGYVAMVF